MNIHPAYDQETRTWFVEGFAEEASTIAELLEKLPKRKDGYHVVGYRPLDSNLPPIRPPSPDRPKPKINLSWPPRAPKPPRPTKEPEATKEDQRPRGMAFDRGMVNKILDLWAEGVSGPEIAQRFGLNAAAVGSHIVARARVKGDPRALIRNHKKIKPASAFPAPPPRSNIDRGTGSDSCSPSCSVESRDQGAVAFVSPPPSSECPPTAGAVEDRPAELAESPPAPPSSENVPNHTSLVPPS